MVASWESPGASESPFVGMGVCTPTLLTKAPRKNNLIKLLKSIIAGKLYQQRRCDPVCGAVCGHGAARKEDGKPGVWIRCPVSSTDSPDTRNTQISRDA